MPQLKLCDSFDKYFSFFVAYLSMESIDNAGTFFRSCLIRDIEHTEREISRMRYTERGVARNRPLELALTVAQHIAVARAGARPRGPLLLGLLELRLQLGVRFLEHLLLGLMEEGTNAAASALAAQQVTSERLRQAVTDLVGRGVPAQVREDCLTPSLVAILEDAKERARDSEKALAGTEHLLVAMLKETDCVATRLLYTMGVNIQKLYVAVLTAMGIENPTAEELQGGRNHRRVGRRRRRWTSTAEI